MDVPCDRVNSYVFVTNFGHIRYTSGEKITYRTGQKMSTTSWRSLPSYDEVSAVFDGSGSKLMEPAEIHGLLCATIVIGAGDELREAMGMLLSVTARSLEGRDRNREFISQLFAYTQRQLKYMADDFELLLLDDAQPVLERANALVVWCQGFLRGLQMAGVAPEDTPSENSEEAIGDIARIALMDWSGIDNDERGEKVYSDFMEFVRIAVLTIHADFNMDGVVEVDLETDEVLH